MNWSANVLTTVTSDTEPTIIIEFDSGKYIFNVGDNTNRAFMQSAFSWKKTKGIFLSSVGTQRASGLSGLLMTIADAGLGKVDVVGPQGLTHFIASMRKYVYRDYFAVTPTEVPIQPTRHDLSKPPNPFYADKNVTVYAIPIIPVGDDLAPPVMDHTPFANTGSTSSLKRKRTPSPTSNSKRSHFTGRPSASSSQVEESAPLSIHDLAKAPSFNPRYLQGNLAHEWREFMVQTIFSQKRPSRNDQLTSAHEEQHTSKKKGLKGNLEKDRPFKGLPGKGPAVKHNSSPEHGTGGSPMHTPVPHHILYPDGFHEQLPAFSMQHREATNTPETKPTLAYAVVGPRVRGKFDAVKAEELGVPNGYLRRDLIQGKAIRFMVPNEEGEMVERVVGPEEIIGESENPSVVLILDTPTLAHISPLISSFDDPSFFANFRSKQNSPEYTVRVIFHLCGVQVLEDERYKKFMNGFAADVQHVIASREHGADPVTFTNAASNQLRLKQLDPDIFRVPKFHLATKKPLESIPGLPPCTSYMRANIRHGVRPFQPPLHDKIAEEKDTFHPAIRSSTTLSLSEATMKCFSQAKSAVKDYAKSGLVSSRPGSDVVITPLGTSSAVPTKYRNVSGTLIQIPTWGNILLDAGEGTWGQLSRHFGRDDSVSPNVWETLRNLKCIFISHLHADHHSGLAKILSMRCRLDPQPKEPLYLVAPSGLFVYLHEYSDIEDLGLYDSTGNGVKCIQSEVAHISRTNVPRIFGDGYPWQNIPNAQRLIQDLCRTLGLQSFTTVDVLHTSRCHAAIIKHKDGWSIVFSGDTIPADKLVKAGDNSTLLIHEASMADDQLDLATSKMHSTFGQAVHIGRRMHAENILLTHFSARYPRMPPSGIPKPSIKGSAKEPILALAFDNIDIMIGDMWKINFYLRAIEQSFEDTEEPEDNEGAVHVEVDIP